MVVSVKYKKDSIGVLLTFLSIYVTDPISDTLRTVLKLKEIRKKDQ